VYEHPETVRSLEAERPRGGDDRRLVLSVSEIDDPGIRTQAIELERHVHRRKGRHYQQVGRP
jgi:hypothetical protein